MTIKIGDNPEGNPKTNKFLDHKSHEGHRGVILAIKNNGQEAIIKSLTTGFEGIVKAGEMYLVEEIHEDQYPTTVKKIRQIPTTKNWSKMEGKN